MEDLLPRVIEYLPYYVLLLLALSVHEAAHAWAAKMCGDPFSEQQGRLTLNPIPHIDPIGTILLPWLQVFNPYPLICWAKPVPVVEENLNHPRDLVWIALAGPASNLVMAFWTLFTLSFLWSAVNIVFTSFGFIGPQTAANLVTYIDSLTQYFFYFIFLNFFLAFFNLIPVAPLDGSRLVYYLFFQGRSYRARYWAMWEQWGFIIFLIAIFTGLFNKAILPWSVWMQTQIGQVLW